MKIEHDVEHDIAYIALTPSLKRGAAKVTTHGNATLPEFWQRMDVEVTFKLDWDGNGALIGIELAPASKLLPKEALK